MFLKALSDIDVHIDKNLCYAATPVHLDTAWLTDFERHACGLVAELATALKEHEYFALVKAVSGVVVVVQRDQPCFDVPCMPWGAMLMTLVLHYNDWLIEFEGHCCDLGAEPTAALKRHE